MVLCPSGRGVFCALAALLVVVATGCVENRTVAGPGGLDLDVDPPFVVLHPAADTTVDSVGVLTIRVIAIDQSNIKELELVLVGSGFGFAPLQPDTNEYTAQFAVPLGISRHSSFGYYVRARDILDLETVTPTVTVTVR